MTKQSMTKNIMKKVKNQAILPSNIKVNVKVIYNKKLKNC